MNRMILSLIAGILALNVSMIGAQDLAKLLPDSLVLKEADPFDAYQTGGEEKLFELINGGAVLFLKHGFKETLFQEYMIDSTRTINLEIYRMASPEGAKGIFDARADSSAEKISMGEQGLEADYYCAFHNGPFYVTVTGSDTSKVLNELLLQTAGIVDKKIRDTKSNIKNGSK